MAGHALFLQIIEGKAQAHFIMDDPAGNSYLQVQPCALPLGSLSSLGGFYFPGTCWDWVHSGALGTSRLLKALLALWVLSLGSEPVQCRNFPCPHRMCTPQKRTRS